MSQQIDATSDRPGPGTRGAAAPARPESTPPGRSHAILALVVVGAALVVAAWWLVAGQSPTPVVATREAVPAGASGWAAIDGSTTLQAEKDVWRVQVGSTASRRAVVVVDPPGALAEEKVALGSRAASSVAGTTAGGSVVVEVDPPEALVDEKVLLARRENSVTAAVVDDPVLLVQEKRLLEARAR